MRPYKSPRGEIYNLDNFAMFKVVGSMVSDPGGDRAHFRLEGCTLSGYSMVIHTGSEKECASELNEIDRLLRLPWSGTVSLSEDTLSRLSSPLMQRVNERLEIISDNKQQKT